MIVVKNIVGSFIGTLAAICFARWIGWLPSHGFAAEQYTEIATGLLAVFFALGIVCALLLVAKAIYLTIRSAG